MDNKNNNQLNNLIIRDDIYGFFHINESVLIELIKSNPMQRLKGVSQYGMPDNYYHKKGYSRYDHSIGVFLLLRKLRAGLEEQISGLLHDVSHTAFSHVIDRVFGDLEKEDFQDKNHLRVIENSELKNILDKYKYDYRKIADFSNFSLLEKEIPSLCADRIDYTLRELFTDGFDVKKFILDLDSYKGQIIFKDKSMAFDFAKKFLGLQKNHWGERNAVVRYEILASVLKKALNLDILSENDFYKQDYEILNFLERSEDLLIKNNLKLLRGQLIIYDVDKGGISLRKKFRYIDPEIIVDKKIMKLSKISREYKEILDKEKENSSMEKRVFYMGWDDK